MIKEMARSELITRFGVWREIVFYDGRDEHIALVYGDVAEKNDVVCRIHSSCISAHVFNSVECDCREQMELAQKIIKEAGCGLVIYLEQDGRGNGHVAKVASESLKKQGFSQSDAYQKLGYSKDSRSFTRAAEILDYLEIISIALITNNPKKIEDISSFGISVSKNISATTGPLLNPENEKIEELKKDKAALGHKV